MKKLLVCVASIAALIGLSPAFASDGCGSGWYRDYYGRCIPKHYGYGGYAYGGYPAYGYYGDYPRYYRGRGYWYGDRYYGHRRWDGGWRYW